MKKGFKELQGDIKVKVKLLTSKRIKSIEECVNEFIKDKDVYNIEYDTSTINYRDDSYNVIHNVLVIYEEGEVEKLKYRVRDTQFECKYFAYGRVYDSKKEICEQLISYHSVDCNMSEERQLLQEERISECLNALCDFGWEIEEV